jgi:PII-like signaling protein
MGMAGATVGRGIMGFGANSRVHIASLLRISEDLPVVVYIVDTEPEIVNFLEVIDEMIPEGLVATWDATVEIYRHGK